jgi:hypothetical protein
MQQKKKRSTPRRGRKPATGERERGEQQGEEQQKKKKKEKKKKKKRRSPKWVQVRIVEQFRLRQQDQPLSPSTAVGPRHATNRRYQLMRSSQGRPGEPLAYGSD